MQHSILWYTIIQHNYKRIYVCMCVCTYVGTNVFVFVFLPAFVSSHIACLWLSFMSFFSPFFVAMSSLAHSLSLSVFLSVSFLLFLITRRASLSPHVCFCFWLRVCVCVGFLFVLLFGATSYFLFFNNYSYIKKPILLSALFSIFLGAWRRILPVLAPSPWDLTLNLIIPRSWLSQATHCRGSRFLEVRRCGCGQKFRSTSGPGVWGLGCRVL